MNRQLDLKINRQVRATLVRHWIDLGKLAIRSAMGRVWIHGSLDRIYGKNEELTPALVEAMFLDLKRIKGVSFVSADIDNWSDAGGKWQPMQKKRGDREKLSGESGNETPGRKKFDIADKTGHNLPEGVTEL